VGAVALSRCASQYLEDLFHYPMMNFRRFKSILLKEYRHILREPRTLWMVFLSPAFVLVALSVLFASGAGGIDLAVWDQDRTPLSRQFAAVLDSDTDFSVVHVSGYEEIDDLLVGQRVDAAVVIPPGFASTVQGGRSAPVQVVLDGVDTLVAGKATGSLLGHALDFGLALSRQLPVQSPSLQVRSQAAYLASVTKRNSMIPGLIPIVFSLPAMAAALALARERESGSLESLITTPVRGLEVLGGNLVAYVSTALVALLPVWFEATVLFGVPFRGDPFLLVALTAVFLLANMGQALFIGSVVRSQQTATVIALFVFFVPGFFLVGLIDPIDTTNLLGSAASYALPATHFVTICRALFIKGATLSELWRPTVMLLGLAAFWLGMGSLVFRKRMS